MKGMWKWLSEVYIVVTLLHLFFHSWVWSWSFALRGAFWVFLGGGALLTLFSYLCAKASIPRPAKDYLGNDGQVRMPLVVRILTWSAFGVLLAGSALILVEVFSNP